MGAFVALLRWSCAASGIILLALGVVIVIDVLSRWLFNRPIPGVFETAQVTFVVVSFLALGWVQRLGRQMRVDVLSARVRGRPARAMEAITNLLALVFFGMLLWRATFQWLEAWQIGDVQQGLVQIPMVIPIGGMVIGTVLLGLTLVVAIVADVRGLVASAPGPSLMALDDQNRYGTPPP